MEHRRLKILFALISLFAFGVIVWYFLFSTPKAAPTLEGTASPLSLRDLPARLGFIFQGNEPESSTETEVTLPGKTAFLEVWDKPSSGNVFVNRTILKEIQATSTVGTTTVVATKTVRATTTVLMFVDRATGYVYGHDIESGTTYQISNTTLPGIHDAYIFAGGDRILMRYLDEDKKTIKSILASIPNVQAGHDAQALSSLTTLPNNISSVAMSPSLASISYVVPTDAGSSIYTVTAKNISRVADSPFSEWLLSYGGEQLYATTKASAYIEGMTVSLPSFSRMVGGKTGLTTAAAPGGILLNSMWAKSGLVTFSTKLGAVTTFGVKTLSAKCAPTVGVYFVCGVPGSLPYSAEGLPDDWYQGRFSFDDELFVLNASSGESYSLYSFDAKYKPFDTVSIRTTTRGDILSFIRKQDGSLFLLNTNLLTDGDNE